MSFLAAYLRFDVQIRFLNEGLAILSPNLIMYDLYRFCYAYWLTPNVVGLTQIIMIGGLYSHYTQQIDLLLLGELFWNYTICSIE